MPYRRYLSKHFIGTIRKFPSRFRAWLWRSVWVPTVLSGGIALTCASLPTAFCTQRDTRLPMNVYKTPGATLPSSRHPERGYRSGRTSRTLAFVPS